MPIIKDVHAREILDSRGNPTVEVDLLAGDFISRASVPSGASTGKYEAVELRDAQKRRFLGKGVLTAVRNVNRFIRPRLKGMDCREQQKIDRMLIHLDGTKDKHDLGANALLGVSMAACRAGAHASGQALFHYTAQMYRTRHLRLPRLFFNVINGGRHAGNGLAIQEFMITPRVKRVQDSVRIASEVYQTLKTILEKRYGRTAINVGDEGGFAPPLTRTEDALELLMKALRELGYEHNVGLALDCAASEFYHSREKKYIVAEGKRLSGGQLLDYYRQLVHTYPIVSIEDPFEQDDFEHFAELTRRMKRKVHIVADDLTVTNVHRIHLAAQHHAATCLLLKMNQIGTVTEALEAARAAHEAGWRIMVSHRSGETTDDFISDLAVGIGAEFMKAGAPARGERVAKYNQLLRIEEMMGW